MKRRWLLRSGLGAMLGWGPFALTLASAQAARSPLVESAISYVLEQPSEHPYAAVLDYSVHSSLPRFHVIDLSLIHI